MLFCDVRIKQIKIILILCTIKVNEYEFCHIHFNRFTNKQFMLKYLDMEKFVLSDSKANYTIFPLILNLFLLCGSIKQQEIWNFGFISTTI